MTNFSSLGNRFVNDLGATSQRCHRCDAVAGCKWAFKCFPIRLISGSSGANLLFGQFSRNLPKK